MDAINEAREHLSGLQNLLNEIETKSEKVDLEVSRQRTRFFKAYCFMVFGHLYDKSGVCKRCGIKKVNT